MLERQLPDADLRQLVDLPAGLDYNEWLASHSEWPTGTLKVVENLNFFVVTVFF